MGRCSNRAEHRLATVWVAALVALAVGCGVFPAAHAQSPMKIVEDAGAWKVIIGGMTGIFVVGQSGQAILSVVPANQSLYLYARVSDVGLETISVHFEDGTGYILPPSTDNAAQYRLTIGAADSISFIHALTAGKTALIVAGPHTYPISLAGSSSAIDALSFYGKEHDLNLPPPFTPAVPYGPAETQTLAVTPATPRSAPGQAVAAPPVGVQAQTEVTPSDLTPAQELFATCVWAGLPHVSSDAVKAFEAKTIARFATHPDDLKEFIINAPETTSALANQIQKLGTELDRIALGAGSGEQFTRILLGNPAMLAKVMQLVVDADEAEGCDQVLASH